MVGIIKGTGSSIPSKVINNYDISKLVDTNDQWIQERTGVKNRHIVRDETTVSMAIEAAERALENSKVHPLDIDMIIVATVSSNVNMPNTACMVQASIGARYAVCFDLNAACSGFLFAFNTIQVYMKAKLMKRALVIGAESLSYLVDWTDRGTCILFGDGAGAVVIEVQEGESVEMMMYADGEKGQALTCETIFPHNKFDKGDGNDVGFIRMNGQEVFKFAVKQVPKVIEDVLQKSGIDKNEIDYFILHQANKRIVEVVAKRLSLPIERFPMNLQEYGNTSSASIPILLDEMNRDGRLKPGMKLVMSGFGAGLTWGATYLEWK